MPFTRVHPPFIALLAFSQHPRIFLFPSPSEYVRVKIAASSSSRTRDISTQHRQFETCAPPVSTPLGPLSSTDMRQTVLSPKQLRHTFVRDPAVRRTVCALALTEQPLDRVSDGRRETVSTWHRQLRRKFLFGRWTSSPVSVGGRLSVAGRCAGDATVTDESARCRGALGVIFMLEPLHEGASNATEKKYVCSLRCSTHFLSTICRAPNSAGAIADYRASNECAAVGTDTLSEFNLSAGDAR